MASIETLTRWAMADYIAQHGVPYVGEVITLDLGFGACSAEYVVQKNHEENPAFLHMPDVALKRVDQGGPMPDFFAVHRDPTYYRRPPVSDRRVG